MGKLTTVTALTTLLLQLCTAIQPESHSPPPNQEFRELVWGDINFLHTTDNHGWHAGHLQEPQYSADLGDYISFISHMRRRAEENGVDLYVLDSGDRAEGNGLWDASNPKGYVTRSLVRKWDVDILTTGNHELYNRTTALLEHLEMVPYFGDRYLSSNIDIDIDGAWKPFANRSLTFTTPRKNLTITAFGFIFNFTGAHPIARVKPVSLVLKEPWFLKEISNPDVDMFLVVSHVDLNTGEMQEIHDAIRAVNPDKQIQFFGGHSHIRNFKVFDEKSSALQSGRYCETAGFLSLSGKGLWRGNKDAEVRTSRRYIDFNRDGFMHHSGTDVETFDTLEGIRMTEDITAHRQDLLLNELIGCAPQDFSLSHSPYPSESNWYSYLTTTLLPVMVRNPNRAEVPHMIFINGGSQRFDVFKGAFTYDTSFLVSPFTSRFHFARDVDYSVAEKLLQWFINDASPYSTAAAAMGESPITPNTPLHRVRRRERQQHVLGMAYNLTKGYTTSDAWSATDPGDDVVHIGTPRYPAPKVLQSNAEFPADGTKPEKVDVVFFDFIAGSVAQALNDIEGGDRWNRTGFEMYMGYEDTLTKLILEFVKTQWKCPEAGEGEGGQL